MLIALQRHIVAKSIFWEYCCLSVYGIWGKTHTIDFKHAYNARGKPSSKECFDMLETCFFNMLLTTSISFQFVASFDVEAR